eukprot:CAMPEP_0178975546 /NCGR_PEP_ID=MMETSP0789-20121207/23233_1 /TAXON_ID=3005 /ORGANISM="Rhizosolenia setigera, Strain CCMP 1694" /LENGTH=197 /DNA_ID=CAMNT_0020664325 /DNA_START=60 /DNA_END=652 /DNA_ORIENTATION=+
MALEVYKIDLSQDIPQSVGKLAFSVGELLTLGLLLTDGEELGYLDGDEDGNKLCVGSIVGFLLVLGFIVGDRLGLREVVSLGVLVSYVIVGFVDGLLVPLLGSIEGINDFVFVGSLVGDVVEVDGWPLGKTDGRVLVLRLGSEDLVSVGSLVGDAVEVDGWPLDRTDGKVLVLRLGSEDLIVVGLFVGDTVTGLSLG